MVKMAHKDLYLRLLQPINKNADLQMANRFLPEIGHICSNRMRASILYLLIKSPDTLHAMQVEKLAFKIGVRPRVVIYHLEKLREWGLVEVKKNQKYGSKNRRTIWGIDLNHPSWVSECYNVIMKHFFDEDELEELTDKNRSFRAML